MALRSKRSQAPKPIFISKHADDFSEVHCEECGSGESPGELLLCDKCDEGFHLFCLRPILVSVPKGSWFCPSCSKQKVPKSFPLIQTKIIDFFRIQRSTESTQKPSQDIQKKRKRSSSLVMSKKRRKLLPFNPSEDHERRLEQMRSLATALTAAGTEFSNELSYRPSMAPRSANKSALEKGGMQVLSKEDAETLNLCKKMMDGGEWPPLMVVFDPEEGFTVEADRFIKDLTIISEYVGDVDYLKNRENDGGDSMMTLLHAANPSQSLVICPDKRGNVARFINGINNFTQECQEFIENTEHGVELIVNISQLEPLHFAKHRKIREGKRKQNLKCVRYDVNGECRVLLVANRDISKGERLYYDYNGYEQEYPTQHFV